MKSQLAVRTIVINGLDITSPVVRPAAEVASNSGWLRTFFGVYEPVVVGDDSGTTFLSCAAVITCAVALSSDSPLVLTQATQFPATFVTAVCNRMKAGRLLNHPEVVNLQRLIARQRQDARRIWSQVEIVGNVFWDINWSPETEFALEALRQRVVFGGQTQNWIDSGALAYFGLLESQSMGLPAK